VTKSVRTSVHSYDELSNESEVKLSYDGNNDNNENYHDNDYNNDNNNDNDNNKKSRNKNNNNNNNNIVNNNTCNIGIAMTPNRSGLFGADSSVRPPVSTETPERTCLSTLSKIDSNNFKGKGLKRDIVPFPIILIDTPDHLSNDIGGQNPQSGIKKGDKKSPQRDPSTQMVHTTHSFNPKGVKGRSRMELNFMKRLAMVQKLDKDFVDKRNSFL
jgi:hypothetical protein